MSVLKAGEVQSTVSQTLPSRTEPQSPMAVTSTVTHVSDTQHSDSLLPPAQLLLSDITSPNNCLHKALTSGRTEAKTLSMLWSFLLESTS